MGTDQNIHHSFFQVCQCFFLFRSCPEPAQKIYPHRKILHTLNKGIIMLLGQNCGRHQIDHLFSLLDRFKCRPDRNLRLSEAHIAADQAVHDLRTFHVPLGSLDGKKLIFCFFKRKHFFKLSLPYRIRTVHKALLFLPCRIKLHQLFCNALHCFFHPGPGLIPFLTSQFIQLRCLCIGPGILLDHIRLSGQHIEIASSAVLDLHIVLGYPIHLNLFNSPVDPQSVTFMNHIISDIQFCKILDLLPLSLIHI